MTEWIQHFLCTKLVLYVEPNHNVWLSWQIIDFFYKYLQEIKRFNRLHDLYISSHLVFGWVRGFVLTCYPFCHLILWTHATFLVLDFGFAYVFAMRCQLYTWLWKTLHFYELFCQVMCCLYKNLYGSGRGVRLSCYIFFAVDSKKCTSVIRHIYTHTHTHIYIYINCMLNVRRTWCDKTVGHMPFVSFASRLWT